MKKPANPPGTPGAVLAALMKEKNMRPSVLGRLLEEEGFQDGYQQQKLWKKDRGFNEVNQRLICRIFEVPFERFAKVTRSDAPHKQRLPSLQAFIDEVQPSDDEIVFLDGAAAALQAAGLREDPGMGSLTWPQLLAGYRSAVSHRRNLRVVGKQPNQR